MTEVIAPSAYNAENDAHQKTYEHNNQSHLGKEEDNGNHKSNMKIVELTTNGSNSELDEAVENGSISPRTMKKSKTKSRKKTEGQSNIKNEKSPIFEAIQVGDVDELNRLITIDRIPIETRGKDNCTPLHVACDQGQIECLQILLNEKKADLVLRDDRGSTPLHSAVMKDQTDCIALLVKKYPNLVWEIDNEGNNSIHQAATSNAFEALKAIHANLPADSIGSKINIKNKKGQTALHLAAASSKDGKSVNFLLSTHKGVISVDEKDDVEGRTPLHFAARKGNTEAVRLLIEEGGAQVNLTDNQGNISLHFGALSGEEALVSLLIRKGAKVVTLNNGGKTPMHLATEEGKDGVCYILTTNGADVSIRYQYGRSNSTGSKMSKAKSQAVFQKDEEIMEVASQTDRYGYVSKKEKRRNGENKGAVGLQKKFLRDPKEESKRIELERRRAQKYVIMTSNWDAWMVKKQKKVKQRLIKGIPDCLRGEIWRLMCQSDKIKKQNPNKFQELLNQPSEWAEQIDLDVNRSARDHVQFKDRFGTGQISLFNILKAYSVYDKEVGYCQGMSDMAAFLLMYQIEEDVFWMMVQLLNDPKYDLHGRFLPGFPLLQRTFWIWDKILEESLPKVHTHLKKENVLTTFYATKWFLLVFLDAFPFPITIRLWDLFLYVGYDVVYSITLAIMKLFERNLLNLPFDQILGFFRSFEEMEDLDPDEFIAFIMKQKVDPMKIRRLEEQYQEEKSSGNINGTYSNTNSNR